MQENSFFGKFLGWIVQSILGIVAYWKGTYDQEQRGMQAAKEETKHDQEIRDKVEDRLRTSTDDELGGVRSKWDRD